MGGSTEETKHGDDTDEGSREVLYGKYVTGREGGDVCGLGPFVKHLVRTRLPADKRAKILDLGCGEGSFVQAAIAAGYTDVHGVDRSPEQVAFAHRRGLTTVREGDLFGTITACEPESYDVITTIDLIEHLTRAELIRLATETLRVLRKGGTWVVHCPNAESPWFGRVRYGDLTHETAYTSAAMKQLGMTVGFRSVDVYEDVPRSAGLKGHARRALWQIIRSGARVWLAVESGARDGIFSQNLLAILHK
jgi:SAM-dependent methyltransferase